MHNSDMVEDAQIWECLLKGDRGAISDLFRKYYHPLLNYGLKLVPKEDLVKDSIQELFFVIWESRNRLSEVEYVRAYLYSSLRRTVFRQIELRDTRKKRDIHYSEEHPNSLISHEEMVIMREIKLLQKEKLKKALELLSEREEEAVFLKFYSGLTNQEIADVMGVNRQTVYNYIYRAINVMKEYLDAFRLNSFSN